MSLLLLLLLAGGCNPREKTEVRVLFAGSLIIPFADLEAAYEAAHPDVDVLMEGHGSIQCIRHVTELDDPADVVAVADHGLIPLLMYDTLEPESGEPYADWYVEFATNELTLAYTDQSKYGDEINVENWYEVASRPDTRLGLSDPRFDAAGYRGLMAFQLAEMHYDDPHIFDQAFGGRFQSPIRARPDDDGRWIIRVPEIVQPKDDSGIIVRGGSIQLIALLESGDIDYAFEHESVSRQHGFHYVRLPSIVNLGSAEHASTYEQVEVQLDFQRFASVDPRFVGKTIGYGITIPVNAPHPEEAADLVAFLLGPEGQAVMEANYHPLTTPPRADNLDAVPASVSELCVPMEP